MLRGTPKEKDSCIQQNQAAGSCEVICSESLPFDWTHVTARMICLVPPQDLKTKCSCHLKENSK